MKRIIVILLGCMFLLSFVSLAEDNQQGEKKKPRTASKTVHMYNYPKYQVLGSIYEQGDEAEQSYTKAASCYTEGIEKGQTDCYYPLGRLYEQGLGVEQNLDKAIELYQEAAKYEDADAIEALKRLE